MLTTTIAAVDVNNAAMLYRQATAAEMNVTAVPLNVSVTATTGCALEIALLFLFLFVYA